MKYNLSKFDWKLQSTSETDKVAKQLKSDGIDYSPAFLRLCASRGITNKEQLEQATDQKFQLFHDPFLLKDMEKAVERIQQAIELDEVILIYGDYDADGITSTLILLEALESIGANVHYYLPNRLTDGYGPNTDTWKRLVDELGVQLFITVDNGIAGVETIHEMNKIDIDTIVTDHHELQAELPDAYAIIHPKHPEGNYPFKELSGAGVSLKLATALLDEIPTEALELAAIGTVADMVDITNENRTIVLSGLNLMKDTLRIGLSLLLEGEGVSPLSMDTETIGFIIGPRLNAIGRLGDPTPALELLRTIDYSEAVGLLELVNGKNAERQKLTTKITSEIEQRMAKYETLPKIIIEADPNWPAGILGIAASRLVKDYQRPTILFQYIEEKQQFKGSSRSISKVNIFDELLKQKDYLAHFGGHSQAAGLTIDKDKWEEFNVRIQEEFRKYDQVINEPEVVNVDIDLKIDEINLDFIQEINQLAPFGIGNPKPKFLIQDTMINNIRMIGSNSEHLKMILSQNGQGSLQTIGFGKAEQAQGLAEGSEISIIGELSINEWNGNRMPQLMVDDFGIKGSQWIDYRSSTINPDLFRLDSAVYLFSHEKISSFMANNQLSNKTTMLFSEVEQSDLSQYNNLVVMEPPIQIQDLNLVITNYQWETVYIGSFVHESKYMAGIPSREDFVKLYKVVYKLKAFNFSEEFQKLSKSLNFHPVKLKAMFMMFLEAKFVTIEDGWLELNKETSNSKVDLTELRTFKQYQDEYQSEALLNYQPLNKIREFFEGK